MQIGAGCEWMAERCAVCRSASKSCGKSSRPVLRPLLRGEGTVGEATHSDRGRREKDAGAVGANRGAMAFSNRDVASSRHGEIDHHHKHPTSEQHTVPVAQHA